MARGLDFQDPVVVQGMYIFKQPGVGGEFVPHVDCSYLFNKNSPGDGLVGFWLALDDATVENGCLNFVPGSHKNIDENNIRRFRVTSKDPLEAGMEGEDPVFGDDERKSVPVEKGSLILISKFIFIV